MSVGEEYTAAGLSGLSLPDAPCEHTDIREREGNLNLQGQETLQGEGVAGGYRFAFRALPVSLGRFNVPFFDKKRESLSIRSLSCPRLKRVQASARRS